jgi:hypothetical protein
MQCGTRLGIAVDLEDRSFMATVLKYADKDPYKNPKWTILPIESPIAPSAEVGSHIFPAFSGKGGAKIKYIFNPPALESMSGFATLVSDGQAKSVQVQVASQAQNSDHAVIYLYIFTCPSPLAAEKQCCI